MNKIIASIALAIALSTSSPAFAGSVDDTARFVYDLTVHVHGASAVMHDGVYKLATNQPHGFGVVYEYWVDQGDHGGLSIVVGEDCAACQAITRFYSNGDGTYNTITVFY